jgi:hypothetical protein
MSAVGEDPAAVRRRVRSLRQRERREEAKQRKVAASAYLGEIKTPDVALMVFVLAGHDAAVAADFFRGRGRGSDPSFRNDALDLGDLSADIEWAYTHTEVDRLVDLLETPVASKKASRVEKASRYVVKHKLFQYTVHQNCEVGVAPSRVQYVEQAMALVPKDTPQGIAAKLRHGYSGGPHSDISLTAT